MVGKRFDGELLKLAVDTSVRSGAKEVTTKLVEEEKHQIRFSKSSIDVNKEWKTYYLDIFLSKGHRFSLGRKINALTIQDPNKKKIKRRVPKQVKLLDEMPKSKLYWGMDKDSHSHYPSIDGLYDKRIENFSDKAPELAKETIDISEKAGAKNVAGVLHSGSSKVGVLTGYGNGGTYKNSYCRTTIRSYRDKTSSGQGLVATRDLSGIEDKFKKAGKKAGRLAKRSAGGKEGSAGTYDLIMSPAVGANIFGNLLSGANPIMMISGMSPLKKKTGEQIGPEGLTVIDDPLMEDGLNSRPLDSEGTPSERTPLIKNGSFSGPIHNTSTAKFWRFINTIKLRFWKRPKTTSNSTLGPMGMTGTEEDPRALMPAPTNYRFKKGEYSLEEMINTSSRPTIYLTSNWYTRFTNMREGEFSTVPRDATFLIKDGEIKKPIRNLRLKGNLLEMCENIEAIGKDLKQIKWWTVETPTLIPHMKVKNCEFTKAKGKSS
ncbi:MAG: TldD/PmbA family protein [Candidatus Thermoplasmatota archaeon]